MHVLVTCKYEKDRIKNNREKVETSFSHYKSMGPFCCHGNQSFDPISPKTLRSFSPTPVMLHIKCNQDWPTGFRDIQVWKCGRRRRTTEDEGRRTDDGPLVYYKLTLWAFGSGELKMMKIFIYQCSLLASFCMKWSYWILSLKNNNRVIYKC